MHMNFNHSCLLLCTLLVSSCLALKTYPARSIPSGTLETLGSFSSQGSFGSAIRDTRALADHYQQKLVPVLTTMHESPKAVGQGKQSRLLGQARGSTAEMAVLAARMRSSWQAYQSSAAGGARGPASVAAGIGFRLADRCVILVDKLRQELDLVEGYIRAGVQKNLSYLTPGHQRQFNRTSTELDAASAALMSEFDALNSALRNLQGN